MSVGSNMRRWRRSPRPVEMYVISPWRMCSRKVLVQMPKALAASSIDNSRDMFSCLPAWRSMRATTSARGIEMMDRRSCARSPDGLIIGLDKREENAGDTAPCAFGGGVCWLLAPLQDCAEACSEHRPRLAVIGDPAIDGFSAGFGGTIGILHLVGEVVAINPGAFWIAPWPIRQSLARVCDEAP
ncbi:hypothetical protein V5F77_20250 [Xanthobacter sp. DSM 24535]|uniref:hypothetical protein n=1 Tax=Roseixanthobacter psychrophilus TaxID=3119917 RepID=UPI00372AAEBE